MGFYRGTRLNGLFDAELLYTNLHVNQSGEIQYVITTMSHKSVTTMTGALAGYFFFGGGELGACSPGKD